MLCSHGERPILRVFLTKDNPERRLWGCAYYDWADTSSEPVVSELAKLKRKAVLLNFRSIVAERRFKAALMVGVYFKKYNRKEVTLPKHVFIAISDASVNGSLGIVFIVCP
ncbi:hypothetical protein PIB30_079940 [Stylosanthes scabra]|uniref:Uncharacterized protein n=1 Tax=Stylosanthes scabra TaxID=79078 RepID=A0ABU6QQW7_9FABA|nr:hypothetical protein [Stylosanthes scabra]